MTLELKENTFKLKFEYVSMRIKNRDEERAFADSSPRGHFVP